MGVRHMQGTPWHVGYLHSSSGEAIRHKPTCKYRDSIGQCKLKNKKCSGSRSCKEYVALPEEDGKNRPKSSNSKGSSASRSKSKPHSSNMPLKEYEYEGNKYTFSNDRWIGNDHLEVTHDLGQKLAAKYGYGRNYYFAKSKNCTSKINASVYVEPESKEKKKAYVKKPSFAVTVKPEKKAEEKASDFPEKIYTVKDHRYLEGDKAKEIIKRVRKRIRKEKKGRGMLDDE